MFKGAIIFLGLLIITACVKNEQLVDSMEKCRSKCATLNATSYSLNPHTLTMCQCNINIK